MKCYLRKVKDEEVATIPLGLFIISFKTLKLYKSLIELQQLVKEIKETSSIKFYTGYCLTLTEKQKEKIIDFYDRWKNLCNCQTFNSIIVGKTKFVYCSKHRLLINRIVLKEEVDAESSAIDNNLCL